MAALTAGMNRPGATTDLGPGGRPAARTAGPAGRDRAAAVSAGARAVRSWPLLVLAASAAAEVWSGWVGIAQKTGFGLVSPLPGILPSRHLDTSITLPRRRGGVRRVRAARLADRPARDQRPDPPARVTTAISALGPMPGRVGPGKPG